MDTTELQWISENSIEKHRNPWTVKNSVEIQMIQFPNHASFQGKMFNSWKIIFS